MDVGGRAATVDLMAEIAGSDLRAAILVAHNLQEIARAHDAPARGAQACDIPHLSHISGLAWMVGARLGC